VNVKRGLAAILTPPVRSYVRRAPGRAFKTALVRQVLEPSLRGRPRDFVAVTRDRVVLAGSTRDMIQRYIYVFGIWEPHLTEWLRRRLKPGDTFVDVGANVGYFTTLGAKLVSPTGRVVAVEALPETYDALTRNLARNVPRNGRSNVRALNIAAADEQGTLMLYGGEAHNSGTTSTIASSGLHPLVEVAAMPLATALTDEELRTTRLVKIDVEGAESSVLRGLLPAIDLLPPVAEIVVELSPQRSTQVSAQMSTPTANAGGDAVLELLTSHRYVPYLLPNDYDPSGYIGFRPGAGLRRFEGPVTERTDVVFSRFDGRLLV
jgi:FkbM family methyltransferase